MSFISLGPLDVAFAALLLVVNALLSIVLQLGLAKQMLIAATRMVAQLLLLGLVSIPGMMTGQILAGIEPMEAVKYQLLVMFLIAGGTTLGVLGAVLAAARRLTDNRQRLRLDRLESA